MNKKRYPIVRFNNNDWYKSQLKFNLIKNTNKNNNLEITYVESISNKYGFISQKKQFKGYSVASKNLSNYYIIKQNYFAYNPSRINIGSIAFKYPGDKISIVSPLYVSFKVKEDVLNSLFLLNWFQTQYFKKQRMILSEGSVRDSLSFNQLEQIYIYKPDIYTQEIIGIFFKNFNNITQYYSNKIKNLYMIKNALLQNLFINYDSKYPKIRFKEFSDAWEKQKFKNIGCILMNKRIFKDETSMHGEIPFYKIGTFGGTANAYISRKLFEEYKEKYPYPKKGDILLSTSGSIGKIVEFDGKDAYFQDSNIVWFDHKNKLCNKFLKQYYQVINWNGLEGTTIKRLYNKDILNTYIYVPKIQEQAKLGEFFLKVEKLKDLYERKLELLELMKKGFLQKMFV